VRFFRSLEAVLPPEVAAELHWVTRSNPQHELADRMRAGRLAYWDRTLRYSELAVRGEVEVYNPGLAAGVLRVVRSGDGGLDRSRPADALVLEDVPDWLPPGAALITAVPQTPLAHVNLLARNRGIPNAYLGGVLDDPWLDQLSRGYSPLLVHAMAPDRLDLVTLTRSQYSRYQELSAPRRLTVPPVDLEGAPLLVPLEEHELSEMAALRPLLGGKSAGFLALAHVLDDPRAAVAMPDRPIAVTVRAFVEHMVPLAEPVAAMLASDDFRRDARTRALVLEGEEGLAKRYPGADAAELAARFSEEHPPGDALGDLARAGGLVTAIREQPLPPEVLATVTDALAVRFSDYAPTQGLRFRSSANVEDIEGFSGAGLYESSTGFLDAAAQPRARDRKRTVAWALKRTFSSYWSVEAYEERALSGVDHAGGAMGVLVHARFDDPLEVANGVFLLTLLPPGSPERAVLELNVQEGDLSVTNPPPGSSALPEVDRVAQVEPGSPIRVTRVRPSTEVPEGEVLLDDAALEALFRSARRVGDAWLAAANAGVAPAQASRTVVLDFELRVMAPQWPALAEGEPFPPRLVVKQVRSVDPDLAGVPEPVRAAPFPRDVLARARRVDRRVCRNTTFLLDAWEAWTDPARPPDLGHDREPFLAWLRITFGQPPEGLEVPAEVTLDHTELTEAAHPGLAETGAWALALTLAPEAAARAGFDRLEVDADRRWRFVAGDRQASGGGLPCETAIVHATPQDYLRGLLEQALEEGSAH